MQALSSSAQMLMRAHLHAILNSEKSRGQWGGGGGGEKEELFLPSYSPCVRILAYPKGWNFYSPQSSSEIKMAATP